MLPKDQSQDRFFLSFRKRMIPRLIRAERK